MYPRQLYKNIFFVYNWGEQSAIDSNNPKNIGC